MPETAAVPDVLSPGRLGPVTLRNRIISGLSDATVVWPLLMAGLLERTKAKQPART